MRAILAMFLMLPALALAEMPTFTQGEELNHHLSICQFKADAIEVLDADARAGFEAASKVWMAKDNCVSLPVVGGTVGLVVHTAPVVRDGKKLVAKVVEIVFDKKVVGYFLTTGDVNRKVVTPSGVEIKPDSSKRPA